MQIGIIGVGVVGGTLKQWFEEHTKHDVRCFDPNKGMNDSLDGCSAIFISVPVPASPQGQDLSILESAVALAKEHTPFVFIRSTVLPGTNDRLGTISMPEFLTERQAYEDLCRLPVLCGRTEYNLMRLVFPEKNIIMVSNTEAELAKFTHNCFGAMKVSYFNMIYQLCETLGCDFEAVKYGASLTGFIEPYHSQVPGPDGRLGYGGKCFPENMRAMVGFLAAKDFTTESSIMGLIEHLNKIYRAMPIEIEREIVV